MMTSSTRLALPTDPFTQQQQPPRALSVLKRGWSSSAAPQSTQEIWRSVGAVCFDVDSTVCEEEGIDVLAEYCGAGQAVKEWTTKCVPLLSAHAATSPSC